jgi:hypothetical protein
MTKDKERMTDLTNMTEGTWNAPKDGGENSIPYLCVHKVHLQDEGVVDMTKRVA